MRPRPRGQRLQVRGADALIVVGFPT
jgi:hypothetical protein